MRIKTKVIQGVCYHADRPADCRLCRFYKNKKVGCILGKQHCYYLVEMIRTPQEKKCEGCSYAKQGPCVSACCYKDLDQWMRKNRKRKAGGSYDKAGRTTQTV